VAEVSAKGILTAVGDGAATITVTVNGVSGSTPVTVGHSISVGAPALAQAGQDATVTTTFTNTAPVATHGSAGTVRNVAMNLDLPDGWTATAATPDKFGSVAPGQKATTTWSVAIPTGGAGEITFGADATVGGAHGPAPPRPIPAPKSR
jgi:beta-glucosidase